MIVPSSNYRGAVEVSASLNLNFVRGLRLKFNPDTVVVQMRASATGENSKSSLDGWHGLLCRVCACSEVFVWN